MGQEEIRFSFERELNLSLSGGSVRPLRVEILSSTRIYMNIYISLIGLSFKQQFPQLQVAIGSSRCIRKRIRSRVCRCDLERKCIGDFASDLLCEVSGMGCQLQSHHLTAHLWHHRYNKHVNIMAIAAVNSCVNVVLNL